MWHILSPLVQVSLYVIAFGYIMQFRFAMKAGGGLGFAFYLCSGLIPWLVFAETLQRGTNTLVAHANILQKTSLPSCLFIWRDIVIRLIDLFVGYAVFVALFTVTGKNIPFTMVQVIPVMVLQQIFVMALVFPLAAINIFFRDTLQLVKAVVRFWMWVTPVIYPLEIIPEKYRLIMAFNPMSHFISSYHEAVYYGHWLNGKAWLILFLLAVIPTFVSICFFSRIESECRDNL